MVNGQEVSFDRSVPWAEGLAFGRKSVRDSRYWGELRFNGREVSRGFGLYQGGCACHNQSFA